MVVLTYRVTLLEPVLVTRLDGDPNSAVAFDFLPGSVLRGALIGRYLHAQHPVAAELDATDPDVRRLFFDGSTRYLNGYPLDRLDNRVLPTPKSWHHLKNWERPVRDFASEEPEGNEQWQNLKEPFCSLCGDVTRLVKPRRQVAVHTARDPEYGRPRPGSGAVFRYEALAAGNHFEAAVICDNDADALRLQPLLAGETSIGGSRTGGYGRVRFEAACPQTMNWREAGGRVSTDGQIVLTLLSDWLLRDPRSGLHVVDAQVAREAFSAALGVELQFRSGDEATPSAFLRGRVLGGFNRKWGLPLPQTPAIEMGSVFVFRDPGCDEARLRRLEAEGIGERRAEGFGRTAVNWHGAEPELDEDTTLDQRPSTPVTIPPGSEDARVAAGMVERMLRGRLDGALASLASDLGPQIRQPSASQLSRLRAVVQDALQQAPDEGRHRLHGYLDEIDRRQTASKQFARDRVAGQPLLDCLRLRVDDQAEIWQEFRLTEAALPAIGTIRATCTAALAYEYNLRLVLEVLARAAKAKRREE